MAERDRHPADDKAEQEVVAALDVLQERIDHAKRADRLPEWEEINAFHSLEDALIHAREVALHWDKEAKGGVVNARDLLRDHYRHNEGAALDLVHCENALAAIGEAERAAFIAKVKARVSGRKAREEKQRGKDGGREH
jgi:hypothetical protein